MRCDRNIKISVLRKIQESKDILFGRFSDTLTKKTKVEAWKSIHEHGASIGYKNSGKGWTYLRDIFWPNARRVTLKKVEGIKKIGFEGISSVKLNEIDCLVLDIIGENSSNVELSIPECPEKSIEFDQGISDEDINVPSSSSSSQESAPNTCDIIQNVFDSKRPRDMMDSYIVGKRRKLQLELEHLELQNYSLKLDILLKEKKLNLQPSIYTEQMVDEHFCKDVDPISVPQDYS